MYFRIECVLSVLTSLHFTPLYAMLCHALCYIVDSRGTVQEVMAHVTSTLALCALEVDESAVCIDMSRCHVKLFEREKETATAGAGAGAGPGQGSHHNHDHSHGHSHGHEHNSGSRSSSESGPKQRASVLAMWVLRGRAFAALGKYIAALPDSG